MKAEIESTNQVIDIGGGRQARVWEGMTDHGVPFVAYIALVQVRDDEDNDQFARELREHKAPTEATMRAIDAWMII